MNCRFTANQLYFEHCLRSFGVERHLFQPTSCSSSGIDADLTPNIGSSKTFFTRFATLEPTINKKKPSQKAGKSMRIITERDHEWFFFVKQIHGYTANLR